MSSAFTDLPTEIIHDVLSIGAPRFRDLAGVDETDGRWADVVRSKKFRNCRIKEDAFDREMDEYLVDYYDAGLVQTTRLFKGLIRKSSWADMEFPFVSIRPGKYPLEVENRILQHLTQSVLIERSYCDPGHRERGAQILELLATRPITKLAISMPADEHQVKALLKILENPTLRSLTVCSFCAAAIDVAMMSAFIKKPNFLSLKVKDDQNKNELAETFLECVLELTSFPPHMQWIQLIGKSESDQFEGLKRDALELGFKHFETMIVTTVNRAQGDGYCMEHPADATRHVELLVYAGVVEICVRSKEASKWNEFSEYAESLVGKHLYGFSPFTR